jgi:hypothetical protein
MLLRVDTGMLNCSAVLVQVIFGYVSSFSPLLPPGYRLINYYCQLVGGEGISNLFVLPTFSQVMHFIITWLCAVQRGKGTGHPTPFNPWLSMPCGGGMGCAVCVFMCVCLHVCVQVYACAWVCWYVHLVPALYEDPTSLWYVHTYVHACVHARTHSCSETYNGF